MTDISVKELPFLRYEDVDVRFDLADADVAVPYTRLRPDSPRDVRWIDVTPGSARVYQYTGADAKRSVAGQIFLRASSAPHVTRVLLFLERS